MIEPITEYQFPTGKYFAILKLIILQQNVSSVWIFGQQHGQEVNGVLRHLVNTLPTYVLDLNYTKDLCVDNENIKFLNIFFVSQSFGTKELNIICPADYTMVLIQNSSSEIVLTEEIAGHIAPRIVFGTINSSTIADLKPDKPMDDLFTAKPSHLNTSTFRIFFHLQPPRSMVFSYNNKTIIFSGSDAHLSADISKMLNVTDVVVQSDFGIEYPNYAAFFNYNIEKVNRTLNFLKFHKMVLSSLTVSDYLQDYSSDADLYASAQLIKGNYKEMNQFLYPYDKECFRIVVPRITTEQRFFRKLSRNSIVQSIGLSAILFLMSRIILNWSCCVHDWIMTFFEIFAALLGQKLPKLSTTLSERLWNILLLLSIIFSTAALSAINYQTLVSVQYISQMDTLDDLMRSDLRIFVEKSKERDFEILRTSLDPKLSSKFVYQRDLIHFMQNRTNNVAYIWSEHMAWVHVTHSQNSASDGKLAKMRLVKEPLYCVLSSPRVASGAPFKHSIDRLFERLFESGIRAQYFKWSIALLHSVNRKIELTSNSGAEIRPLTLSQNYDFFVLLIVGMTIASIAFVLEILWKWFTLERRRGRDFRCQ